MNRKHIVFTCAHTDPDVPNDRFEWLGKLIYDEKPDLVIDLGDFNDLRSLNTFDTRYPQKIVTQSYQRDIEHGNDAQEKLRHKFRYSKKRMPDWIGFEGNHENRIKKAIASDPRLEGDKYGVSFSHLETKLWYTEYHEYTFSAPTLVDYDDICYGHYVGSGNYGQPVSGEHHANSIIKKLGCSVTVGHSHKFDYKCRNDTYPYPTHGLVAGCFKGKEEDWAGQSNREWRYGVAIKRYVSNGDYNLQWVSMEQLEKEYG